MNDLKNIRNFAIIAHVDHGKSTLADRLLEITGVVNKGQHEEQLLDKNPISRERGITIKLAPVRMNYKDLEGKEYILNLIDTPGHVDFSYEVDRTLASIEGVVLLVDATQGIQAQTVANAYKALEKNLTIIPVINKIDLPSAQIDKTLKELSDFIGVPENAIFQISAKTGIGVEKLLGSIITKIPSPSVILGNEVTPESLPAGRQGDSKTPRPPGTPLTRGDKNGFWTHSTASVQASQDDINNAQALIFDSYYDPHRGVIAFVRVFEGSFAKKMRAKLAQQHIPFEITEVGVFNPQLMAKDRLSAGEIGYIITNLKDIHKVQVGDSIFNSKNNSAPLPGYQKIKPLVFASVFTTDPNDYPNLTKALEKLYLNDSALEFKAIYSKALGAGYRVGFLGMLHADVVRERLEREYGLDLVLTPPQVEYLHKEGSFFEPYVKLLIFTPHEYMSTVMRLTEEYRGRFITMDNKNQISITYEMPMSEMISDFFDNLKSISSGYASLDWEFLRYEKVNADKLTLLLNGDPVEEFSEVVVQERSEARARALVAKVREVIPRQNFEVKIQAHYKGKIIASERIAPFRKDVLVKGSKVV